MSLEGQLISRETCCDTYIPPPLSKRLIEKKERLESELRKVNQAITLMEKTPELSELINVVSQLNV